VNPIRSLRAGAALGAALLVSLACTGGATSDTESSSCAAFAKLTAPVVDKGTAPLASTGTIQVGDQYFSPTCLTGATGTVTLTLHNSGRQLHNFSVPEQNIDVDIPAGETVTVKVAVAGKPIGCFCKYHRDAGQKCALLPAA
jgi:uncharacterized cupredoxin-like copper-binding protein